MIKKNKGIIISGILLVLLSVGFTAIINFEGFYEHNTSELIMYFIRTLVRIGVSCGTLVLAYKYGRGFVLKYGWIFIPVGILLSALYNGGGYIDVFNYSIELASLTNTFAIVGFATYFYKYCPKSIIHTIIFWISSFIFLIVLEQNYLTLILFVMVGLMLISARKNKLIGKKSVWILNIVLYVVLFLRTINITLMGIAELTNLFYDSSYMSFIARVTFMKTKWFGAAVEPWLIGGDVAYYKLLWIFGLFGIVAGLVVFAALAAFTFFVCRKCFKNVLTDSTPIAYATASILLVRFVVSMLTNFGIVLYSIFAPIPILSDGTCGYIAIFALLGLIIGKEKVDIHSKRYGFAGRLSNFTKREFVFDGVVCRSIEGVLQSFKCKDTTEQKRICMLSGIDAKNVGTELDWKTEQVLYWNNVEYPRESVEYEELLKRLYESVYEYDSSFRKDIEYSKEYILDHSIGVEDKTETVLTKEEFISNLTMLQGGFGQGNEKNKLLFDNFLSGLILSVSDYSYEPTETISISLLKQEEKKKYMPDVEEITKKQYMSVKRYCDMYFAKLIEKSADKHKSLKNITPEINNLLDRLKCLVNWDTNAYHVENKIYEDKLEFTDGTTSQWFTVYKKIADDLTEAIFEEDKKHIAELWECVVNKLKA